MAETKNEQQPHSFKRRLGNTTYTGKKDITGKLYFKDVARFAELLKIVLCHGEKLIQPENLVPMDGR